MPDLSWYTQLNPTYFPQITTDQRVNPGIPFKLALVVGVGVVLSVCEDNHLRACDLIQQSVGRTCSSFVI